MSGHVLEVYARELEDLLDRAMPGLERGLRMHQLTDQFVEGLPPVGLNCIPRVL